MVFPKREGDVVVQMINEALGLVRRYGPTIMAHLLFLVWLALFVVDREVLPDGASIWASVSGSIDASLGAVGLSLERWYVIAALLLVYLTAFEWLRQFVASLPGLRLVYQPRFDPELIAYACSRLRLEPDAGATRDVIEKLIERAREGVRQKGEHDPYQWMVDREQVLSTYYGNALVALLLGLVWAWSGTTLARSNGSVWLTLLLLASVVFGLRWYIPRYYNRRYNLSGWWAVSRAEKAAGKDDWELAYELRNAARRQAAQLLAAERHPSAIALRWISRLPRRLANPIRLRIGFPKLSRSEDWRLVVSSRRRFAEESPVEVAALDARPFAQQFGPLLERRGTGLFILVPYHSGLALGADREGVRYSFATRTHDGSDFGVSLSAHERLEGDRQARLEVETDRGKGFIARAGNHPLDRLLLRNAPDLRLGWSSLLYSFGGREGLLPRDARDRKKVGGIEIGLDADLELGGSYVLGVETVAGTQATVALRCFRIAASERLLVAWGFIDLRTSDEEQPLPLPWTRPTAWKELLRAPD